MLFKDIHFETIDSTQTWAKEHLDACDPLAITCITADEQTKGRGRFQRKWISPKGQNMYATFVFRLPLDTPHLISIAQIATLTLAKLLLKKKITPQIKWPNDLLLSGKKAAGVLCETSYQKNHVAIFLGIGINVNLDQKSLEEIDQPATSLKVATGHAWDLELLLNEYKQGLGEDLSLFQKEGFAPFYPLFDKLLAYKGKEIKAYDGKKEWIGVLHSISPEGQLNLLLPNGERKTILSGDIKP